jgi:hypothetical protein
MVEHHPRSIDRGESLSSVEINEVVMIAPHPVNRAGLSNGKQCDSILGRIVSIYINDANGATAVAQCESCGHSQRLPARGPNRWSI